MPTLILSPRHTDNSQCLWRAALELGHKGWDVERMPKFHVIPEGFAPTEPVPYGEPMFNQLIAERYNLDLPHPSESFLPDLPYDLRKRAVELMTMGDLRKETKLFPAFVKPPNDKMFPAKVYQSVADLPDTPDTDHVLVQEIVEWMTEYRFFLIEGLSCTGSNYMHRGQYTKDTDYKGDQGRAT